MKIFKGKVTAKKMQKTATVEVERTVIHPLYQKRYKRAKKYQVHDEIGVNVGDTVKFVTCKPISKLKKWRIVKQLSKGGQK